MRLFEFRRGLVIIFLIIFSQYKVQATHLRAGQIIIERLSCSDLRFRITITVFTDIGPGISAKFGDGVLNFGDGSDEVSVPLNESPLDLGNDVGFNQYSIIHTFPGPGNYVVSYTEPNRNEGILNMTNSINTPFHLETNIIIDAFLGCNSTPVLLVDPIDRGCTGSTFFHNPGAFDFEGDSLSYEFVVPKQDAESTVLGFILPSEVEPKGTNQDGTGPAFIEINPITGDIIWDAPAIAGEFSLAFVVKEWRKKNGVVFFLGSVRRDMQIIIEECDNERPELIIPEDICVQAGTVINDFAIGSDPDGDPIKLEAFGGPFEVNPVATVIPDPPEFQASPGVLQFNWQTACGHVREQPYQVEFKVSDRPDTGPSLVEFGTWNIRIVGPAPQLLLVDLDLTGGRKINLSWNTYSCTNASVMQIWRRVERYDFLPDACFTGIPPFGDYQLIDTVGINQISYVDQNNLASGAKYCYRLVAVFPEPAGGESIVSNEICADPIEADAPVITHVSVEKTNLPDGPQNGEIRVSWRSAFEINPIQFPPPYTYEVTRRVSGSDAITIVTPIPIVDTTILDISLNTLDEQYVYQVNVFDNLNNLVESSFEASSVFLDPIPLNEEIQLNWRANVPWTNSAQNFPYHIVFRSVISPLGDLSDPSQLTLYDSSEVLIDGFRYLDQGPLSDDSRYCYYVITKGTYGNPLIDEPQLNKSQIVCLQPSDTTAPEIPILNISLVECDQFLIDKPCNFNEFENILKWERPSGSRSFNIYFTETISDNEEDFILIGNTTDTFFVHKNLPSFKGCYKVSALNRSGFESALSEKVCNDNCPNYELPNVFTPNNDGFNDFFQAFDEGPIDENDTTTISTEISCPRFVENVKFMVYNRWGKMVFEFESTGENSILIKWDGKSNDGVLLPSAVYYYAAEVTFDVLDPRQSQRVLNGWIHLIR